MYFCFEYKYSVEPKNENIINLRGIKLQHSKLKVFYAYFSEQICYKKQNRLVFTISYNELLP